MWITSIKDALPAVFVYYFVKISSHSSEYSAEYTSYNSLLKETHRTYNWLEFIKLHDSEKLMHTLHDT